MSSDELEKSKPQAEISPPEQKSVQETPADEPLVSSAASLPAPARGASQAAPRRAQTVTIPPPGLEELEENYAKRTEISVSAAKTIDDQLGELELWARSLLWRGRVESFRTWALRMIAFFGSITAAATAAMNFTNEAVAAGCVSAVAIAIEAGWPSSGDRLARRRAAHDLRELQHALKLRWDKVCLAHPNPVSPKRVAHALVLLDAIAAKRDEIGKYLGDASPSVTKRFTDK